MVVTGGTRLGMTMARAKRRAVNGSTAFITALSRRWTCQSSGRLIVKLCSLAIRLFSPQIAGETSPFPCGARFLYVTARLRRRLAAHHDWRKSDDCLHRRLGTFPLRQA